MEHISCAMSRRSFVRNVMVQAAALGTARYARSAATRKRPNVLLILSDDQGTLDLNCYGSKDLHTPNLDELARRGTRFTQFYTGAPLCSPSRGSLLTGRYCNHNGVPTNRHSLNSDEITIAEMLKPWGYRTALIGKWHLGTEPGPTGEGFDYFFGFLNGCIENYNHDTIVWNTGDYKAHDLWRNKTPVYEYNTHFGKLIVREVNSFLDRHGDEPFFLYVPFNNPHYPLQPLPHWLEHYAELPEPRRSYAAFVSTL
ncbi:MAG: sulfatase-like hydrolase/transferase, partial [Candidatus Hydrogenedentes bacterium]|nr:sulfatase-like hydrolase/transferase [Candidatus Hydrogenedentota bacterium]